MTSPAVDAWLAAVEDLWYTEGPAALTARRIAARAHVVAPTVAFPTIKGMIYDLTGPDGDTLFGSVRAVIQAAHDNAVGALHVLVNDTTGNPDPVAAIETYVAALVETPARRRMIATLTGPAGPDPALHQIHKQLTRYLGNQGTVAAVHGVTEGIIAGTVAYRHAAITQTLGAPQ